MSAKFWATHVKTKHLLAGYYPEWRAHCEPGTWTCDASHFAIPNCGGWAVLCPTGRLVWGYETDASGAPEMRGIIEAVRLMPEGVPVTLETDQLSTTALLQTNDRINAVRLSQTAPMWAELLDLLTTRDVTLKWVKGHGRQSNSRMAIVDEASRRAARYGARYTEEEGKWPELSSLSL